MVCELFSSCTQNSAVSKATLLDDVLHVPFTQATSGTAATPGGTPPSGAMPFAPLDEVPPPTPGVPTPLAPPSPMFEVPPTTVPVGLVTVSELPPAPAAETTPPAAPIPVAEAAPSPPSQLASAGTSSSQVEEQEERGMDVSNEPIAGPSSALWLRSWPRTSHGNGSSASRCHPHRRDNGRDLRRAARLGSHATRNPARIARRATVTRLRR
jgi:hypothetical protein